MVENVFSKINDTNFGMKPSPFTDGFSSFIFNIIALYTLRERFNISKIFSVDNFSNTITRHRLSSAEFKLNDGFSVVAPINVIAPLSTCGKNISCHINHFNPIFRNIKCHPEQ